MAASPLSPAGLDHVVLLVDDMAAALGFYIDVLGCRPGYAYPALGMEHLADFAEMAGIELVRIDAETRIPALRQQLMWNDVAYR